MDRPGYIRLEAPDSPARSGRRLRCVCVWGLLVACLVVASVVWSAQLGGLLGGLLGGQPHNPAPSPAPALRTRQEKWKGVCWNPVPKGGMHPQALDFRGFVEADAALMRQAGVNAVITYEPLVDRDVLDELWRNGIRVFNRVYAWGGAPPNSVEGHVNSVKDHPAIAMWVVGNEWNYNGLYMGLSLSDAVSRVRDVVRVIKGLDTHHPVATVHGELPTKETIETLHEVDVWGINAYRGLSFGNLFEDWQRLSSKPMFLSEFGSDAYNALVNHEDQDAQAKAVKNLREEIVRAESRGTCIGGFVFELADEWWKDGKGSPDVHDVGGVAPGGGPYPDSTFNEEWFGLVEIDGTPRKAFFAYADSAPVGTPIVQGQSRQMACGAHPKCVGKFGNCCPDKAGTNHSCCSADSDKASCSLHPACSGLAGDCCPTSDGMRLGCCGVPVP